MMGGDKELGRCVELARSISSSSETCEVNINN